MFERFSRDARSVVNAACLAAERRHDSHVGTEHLLIAIASTGPANPLNRRLDPDELQAGLRRLDEIALESIGVSTDVAPHTAGAHDRRRHRRFTSGAKACLQQSLEIAARNGHRSIGPNHLLAAITRRDTRDPAIRLLELVGIDFGELRTEIENALASASQIGEDGPADSDDVSS